jgi:hypothetical protein
MENILNYKCFHIQVFYKLQDFFEKVIQFFLKPLLSDYILLSFFTAELCDRLPKSRHRSLSS